MELGSKQDPGRAGCTDAAARPPAPSLTHPIGPLDVTDARAEQVGRDRQADYALRAGVEGTVHQALAVTDSRHASHLARLELTPAA
ncbi:hypothetical protein [Streptomyces gibsoniae]|uniref:Uncharacterized protein n=1 Tax=Streptomyces gibsoniae TaxID=3075529 RepID=A0ABU2U7X3_9ACTN|nr:hypothetical protein [Streptomyces sp. DSM 41699]MDT0469195.1 hypothetical protein [Streptomyces sp. DSM 41699]